MGSLHPEGVPLLHRRVEYFLSTAPRKESLPPLLPTLVTGDPTLPSSIASRMWSLVQRPDAADREVHHWVTFIIQLRSLHDEASGALGGAADMVTMDLL